MGHDVETIELFDTTDLDTKLVEAHYENAVGYLKIGEIELAHKSAQMALKIDADHRPVHAVLDLIKQEYYISGLTLLKENKITEGIRFFQSAVAIDSTFVDAYCEIGRAFLRLGELDEVEKAAKKILRLNSASKSARELLEKVKCSYYDRARAYLSLGEPTSAEKAITEALRLDSGCELAQTLLEEVKDAYYNFGIEYLREDNFTKAEKAITEVLRLDSSHESLSKVKDMYCGQALTYLNQEKFEFARKTIEMLLELDSNYEPAYELLGRVKFAYYDRGLIFLDKNLYSEAITIFETILELEAGFMAAHYGVIRAYVGQGEFASAKKAISELLRIDPSSSFFEDIKYAYYEYGRICLARGKLVDAEKAAKEVLELDSSYEVGHVLLKKIKHAHYNRACEYLRQNEISSMEKAVREILRLDPDYEPAHVLLKEAKHAYYDGACIYLKRNKFSSAEKAIRKALKIDPSYEAARKLLEEIKHIHEAQGHIFLEKKQDEKAQFYFQKAHAIEGEFTETCFAKAYYRLGQFYLLKDELELAKAAVDETLRMDFEYKPARQLLEKIKYTYYTQGLKSLNKNEYEKAIASFESLLVIDAGFAEGHYGIAHVYFKQGKFEDAGEAISKALRLDSDYKSARELLKKIKHAYCDDVLDFLNKKQHSTAITSFEDGLAINVDYMEAKWEDALVYLELGELEEAEKSINQALGFNSDDKIDLDYWFNSDCEFDSDYGFACALLEKIKHAYYDRGMTALEQNQYDEAIINLENAVAIDADFAEAYIELQVAYFGFESCYLGQLETEEETEKNNVMKQVLEHTELLTLSTKSVKETDYLADETEFSGNYKKSYDELRNWFRTIGRFKLLDRDEEVELAKRIEAGKTKNSYTADAELARDQLVQANLRLVVSIARRCQGQNVSLEDLIQEGNIGLIKAADKFDYRKGIRFSSYASRSIMYAIMHALDNSSRTIRLPSYFIARMKKFDAVHATLCQKLQREPFREEISKALDLPVKQVEKILISKIDAVPMDLSLGGESFAKTLEDLIGDLIEDPITSEEEGAITEMVNEDLIAQLLKRLPEREQKVLKMRYGLEDGEPKTIREVGVALKVTRERVRQLEIEAIKRLRVLYDEMGEFQSDQSWAGKTAV